MMTLAKIADYWLYNSKHLYKAKYLTFDKVKKYFQGTRHVENYSDSLTLMAYGYGIEGFRDRVQEPDNMVNYFPLVSSKSKFSDSFINS